MHPRSVNVMGRGFATFIILAAVALAAVFRLWAQQAPPGATAVPARPAPKKIAVEKLLPAQTIVYATLPDLTASIARFKGTALWEIWQEPDVQAFVNPIIAAVKTKLEEFRGDFEKETSVRWEEITPLLGGQMAFALIEVKPPSATVAHPPSGVPAQPGAAVPQPTSPAPEKEWGFSVAMFFTPDDPEAFDSVTRRMIASSVVKTQRSKSEIFRVNDVPVEAYFKPNEPNEMIICRARLGDTFVYTMSPERETISRIIQAYQGKAEFAALADSPSYQNVRNRLFGDQADVLVYGSVASLLNQLAPLITDHTRPILEATGVSSIEAVGIGAKVEERAIRDAVYVYAPKERKGLTSLFSLNPVDTSLMQLVPNKAEGFLLTRVDLAGLWSCIDEIVRTAAGQEGYASFKAAITKFEQSLGITVKDDLLAPMGHEMLIFSMPSPMGAATWGFGDMSFLFTLQDRAKAEGMANKLAAYVADESARKAAESPGGGPPLVFWQESKHKTYTMNYMSFAEPQKIPVPLNPTYAFTEKHLVVALTPAGCSAMIDAATTPAPAGERLCDGADFKAVYPKLPPGQGLIGYQDVQRSFPRTYDMLKLPLNTIGPNNQFGVDITKLPPAEVITRHLFGEIGGLKSDAEGIILEGYSPYGSGTVVPVVAIGAAIALPRVLQSRIAANEAAAIGSLKTIATQEAIFRQQCEVDQNGNGAGEYGLLGEMSGELALRPKTTRRVVPAYVSQQFHTNGSAGQGLASKTGYNYRIYLAADPETFGDDKTLGGTAAEGGPKVSPAAIKLQEGHFVLYAWPCEAGGTGRRAFAITEMGEVYSSWMEAKRYSSTDGPAANAAYPPGEKPLTGKLADEVAGNDGNVWIVAGPQRGDVVPAPVPAPAKK